MKLPICLTLTAMLGTSCCLAQDSQPAVPTPEPTAQHELLKESVGTWTGTMQMFAVGADLPPMTIKETNTLMDTGLWVLTEFEAGPFIGRGQTGYDPVKKKYVGTWIDNMTPQLMVMEGDYNKETGELIMFTQGIDPATGQKQDMKAVSKSGDGDTRTYTMYTKVADEWVRTFQIDYERDK